MSTFLFFNISTCPFSSLQKFESFVEYIYKHPCSGFCPHPLPLSRNQLIAHLRAHQNKLISDKNFTISCNFLDHKIFHLHHHMFVSLCHPSDDIITTNYDCIWQKCCAFLSNLLHCYILNSRCGFRTIRANFLCLQTQYLHTFSVIFSQISVMFIQERSVKKTWLGNT